ncbi:translation initiation factor IF-2 isoform X2 [Leptidea sinapis]|nr:translation initiation factor IF-2 isoform X2 [Leptidea sinapis]
MERIERCGGKVVSKAGVPRVVWNRPRAGHKGPIKKNTPMDEIPFLAVARSLGDLWSYNPNNDEFIVSPDPDVGVLTIDPAKFRCLIFGTDGLWNMMTPEGAVSLVHSTEKHNEAALVGVGNQPRDWLNPSKSLVDQALERWSNTRMRADNTSVVTLMLDPPGPPRATVLRSRTAATQKAQSTVNPAVSSHPAVTTASSNKVDDSKSENAVETENRQVPENGLTIMTRYSDEDKPLQNGESSEHTPLPPCTTIDGRFSVGAKNESTNESKEDSETITNYGNPAESYFMARLLNRTKVVNTLSEVYNEIVNCTNEETVESHEPSPPPPATVVPEETVEVVRPIIARQSLPPEESNVEAESELDNISIQINEVSSSSPTEGPVRSRAKKFRDVKRDATPNDRVLRSHHESEAAGPQTRQAATRLRSPVAKPLERVVILNRRDLRPQARRPEAGSGDAGEEARRSTRSQHAPAPQKGRQESVRAGNCPRAPGSTRRSPAARELGRSKENLGGGRGRAAAARAPPAPRPRPRRDPSQPEVHSTTGEPARPRALRSRNETDSPAQPPGKRPRYDDAPDPPKVPDKCARPIGKRASGPWAPSLALRNRLRRRLAK